MSPARAAESPEPASAGDVNGALGKVHFDLPHHSSTGGESMWARVLGDDLYELQNSPFFAYGVSYLDVVRAVSPEPGLKPHVVELVRPGGHVTLRVMFLDADSRERQAAILDKLASLGADPERASTSLCALDLPPGVPVDPIRDELDRLEEAGELAYETCEARVPGSFDDHPPDVDAQARACR